MLPDDIKQIHMIDNEDQWCDILDEYLLDDDFYQLMAQDVDIADAISQIRQQVVQTEQEVLHHYNAQGPIYTQLDQDMNKCQEVLSKLEIHLDKFQADMISIFQQIQKVQLEAKLKEQDLKRHQSAEASLNEFINKAILPDNLKQSLMFSIIDDSYIQYLKEFERRFDFIQSTMRQLEPTRSDEEKTSQKQILTIKQSRKQYNQLCSITCKRIYERFQRSFQVGLTNIEGLRNMQVTLLPWQFLFRFLDRHSYKGSELITYYTEKVQSLYYKQVQMMVKMTEKLQYHPITSKKHLIACTTSNTFANFFKTKRSINALSISENNYREDSNLERDQVCISFFLLNHRDDCFKVQKPLPSISTEFLQRVGQPPNLHFESTFHPLLSSFFEYINAEMKFMITLGWPNWNNENLKLVLERSYSLIVYHLDNYLNTTFDLVGIFLVLVGIVQNEKRIQREFISNVLDDPITNIAISNNPGDVTLVRPASEPSAESTSEAAESLCCEYIRPLINLILHRVKTLWELNQMSISELNVNWVGEINMQDVHLSVQHYTDLFETIYALVIQWPDAMKRLPQLESRMALLCDQILLLLVRIAKHVQMESKSVTAFLINNYMTIYNATKGKDEWYDYYERLKTLLQTQWTKLSDALIEEYFGDLTHFIAEYVQIDYQQWKYQYDKLNFDRNEIKYVIKRFAESWKHSLKEADQFVRIHICWKDAALQVMNQFCQRLSFCYAIISNLGRVDTTLQLFLLSTTELQFEMSQYLKN